jgi:DNA repair exonuclease SbcCD ATPase subunit
MNLLQRRASALDGIVDRQIRLLQALEREEKQVRDFEGLEQRLLKELEMSKEEVAELIRDSERIQKPEDIQLAEGEGDEIKRLLQHYQQEGEQTAQLAGEIENEADAVAEDIREDEELFRELEQADESLAELERIIQEERDDLMMVVQSFSRRDLKQTLSEIEETREVIEGVLEGDRNKIEKAEDKAASLVESANALATSAPGQAAASASRSLVKYSAVFAIIAVVVVMALVVGNPL